MGELLLPTRVRYGVLAFVCALSMITYLDRAAFPNVQGEVLRALDRNNISQLKIALTAPPIDRRANEACVEFLAEVLKLPRSSVTIVSGQGSRNKIIRVTGCTAAHVRSVLNP